MSIPVIFSVGDAIHLSLHGDVRWAALRREANLPE